MLEIKDLTKIYKTKGGNITRALDGVTLSFPEKGMVFLLGKSGSGKSTLLNVSGGLDSPTSGEIIVRGRSSKTFTGSDFDSYRNTFIGFIFQEYNLLNEFTVEENLCIALELQGRPADKKKVDELLEMVDLVGYAKRKPNTLSGGQKQRIAIARALIKEPKIIMADEPSGALDSATGKQVFDTLKKLSAERLVIVVSHDREFAEVYGDRIIELKDGKVISDITKEKIASSTLSENLSVIGENVISVKKGSRLTGEDLKKINEFLLSEEDGVILTRGSENVERYKKDNRISDDDSTEAFAATDTKNIPLREYTKEESKFLKSRLPLKKAVKMGASSLKVKPFRLFFTILLSVVAFMMFGVFSTLMMYNEKEVIKKSFAYSDYDNINVEKYFYVRYKQYLGNEEKYSYEVVQSTAMTKTDVDKLAGAVDGAIPYLKASNDYGGLGVYNFSSDNSAPKTLNDLSIAAFAVYDNAGGALKIKYGGYPASAGEIAVSEFFAKTIINNVLYELSEDGTTGSAYAKMNNVTDVIGKRIGVYLSGEKVVATIVGVFDGGLMPAKFDGYDSIEKSSGWDYELQAEYMEHISESLHKVVFLNDEYYREIFRKSGYKPENGQNDYEKYFKTGRFYYCEPTGGYEDDNYLWLDHYAVYDRAAENVLPVHFFGDEKTKLSGNDVILCLYNLKAGGALSSEKVESWRQTYAAFADKAQTYDLKSQEYRDKDKSAKTERDWELANYYENVSAAYGLIADAPINSDSLSMINSAFYAYSKYVSVDEEVAADLIAALKDYYLNYCQADKLSFEVTSDYGDTKTINVVGFYIDPSTYNCNYATGVYVSEEAYQYFYDFEDAWRNVTETNYTVEQADVYYSGVFVPYGENEKGNIDKVLAVTGSRSADDSFYNINNTLYSRVSGISIVVVTMSKVFLYIGIAMAAFAALLLFNFISVSINSKMHEIGVLRAVGARGQDVFKIFFSESFIICAVCIILSVFGTLGVVASVNSALTEALSFSIQLFVFGALPLALVVGVALLVAFLGTFLPVLKIARKKPVDSMKG